MNTLGVAAGTIHRYEMIEIVLQLAVGIVIVAWPSRVAGERPRAINNLLEIVLPNAIGILHNRLPDLAGTLGIPVIALLIVLLRCEATSREVIR